MIPGGLARKQMSNPKNTISIHKPKPINCSMRNNFRSNTNFTPETMFDLKTCPMPDVFAGSQCTPKKKHARFFQKHIQQFLGNSHTQTNVQSKNTQIAFTYQNRVIANCTRKPRSHKNPHPRKMFDLKQGQCRTRSRSLPFGKKARFPKTPDNSQTISTCKRNVQPRNKTQIPLHTKPINCQLRN